MVRAAWVGRLRSRALTRPFARFVGRDAVPSATDAEVENAADGLTRVVETARVRAPGARVVLVDYLALLGDDFEPGAATPFAEAEITAFRMVGERLADAFATAARRSGADLVQASALSAGYGVCSAGRRMPAPARRPSPR